MKCGFFPYVLEEKFHYCYLPMSCSPHQRGKSFFILMIDYIFCLKKNMQISNLFH